MDNVSCIRKYFPEPGELVIANSDREWCDMVSFYLHNPEARKEIIDAGQQRVLQEHTYHHRVQKIFEIMKITRHTL